MCSLANIYKIFAGDSGTLCCEHSNSAQIVWCLVDRWMIWASGDEPATHNARTINRLITIDESNFSWVRSLLGFFAYALFMVFIAFGGIVVASTRQTKCFIIIIISAETAASLVGTGRTSLRYYLFVSLLRCAPVFGLLFQTVFHVIALLCGSLRDRSAAVMGLNQWLFWWRRSVPKSVMSF